VEDTKKIITRAVYGNRIQTFQNSVRIPTGKAEKLRDILGCTVSGAKILSAFPEEDDKNGKKARVDVLFEIHIWYWADNETKVYKADATTSDVIEFEKQGVESFRNEEVQAWMKEKPKCVDVKLVSGKEEDLVEVQLEYVLEAELIGETMLNVKVFSDNEAMETTNKTKMNYLWHI